MPGSAAGTPAQRSLSATDARKLRQALAAYEEGRSETARPILEELLSRNSDSFEVNETLGLIRAEGADIPQALPLLERAVHLRPRTAVAHANLGTAYLKLNQPQRALAELEISTKLEPSNQQTKLNLARACMETNEPAKAARAFAAAAALGPLDTNTRHDQAVALLQSDQPAAAKELIDTIPASQRDDALEELAAEANERLKNYKDAEEHFATAVRLNPSEANLFAWVVELLRHFSWQPAIKIADYAVVHFPGSARLQEARGIGLYGNNQYQEAANIFSLLLKNDPDNAVYADLLGRSCSLVADAGTTCEGLEQFADRHQRNAEAATYAATALLHRPAGQRNDVKARVLLQQALAADPRLASAYYQLGVLEQEETRWEQSVPPLEKAIVLKPGLAEAHYRLARAYQHLGRHEEASKQIELQQEYAKQEKLDLDERLREVTTFLTNSQ